MRLEATGLACVRGGREVFSELGFAVAGGETLLATGPNGAGKSSLLRMIAGLIRIAGGRLTLSGGAQDMTVPEQAHYLGHWDALKPSLTVTENLAFWQRYLGGSSDTLEAALAAVGLAALAGLPAAYLSAGQRRRLSLARLLAVKRPIWLLDEPTAALDSEGQQLLTGLMTRHLQGGGLIVAATHDPLRTAVVREIRLGAAV